MSKLSHVVAFDDAPFVRAHRGDVPLIGVVYAGLRLDGVLSGRVSRDGVNAARTMASMILESRFVEHLQLILLQGIAVAGFNVVDVFALRKETGLPVLVVARRRPDRDAIREVLLTRVRGGGRKWRIIERLGPMEACERVFVQRAGISSDDAARVVRRLAVHSREPEPLRVAHLIAGAYAAPASLRDVRK